MENLDDMTIEGLDEMPSDPFMDIELSPEQMEQLDAFDPNVLGKYLVAQHGFEVTPMEKEAKASEDDMQGEVPPMEGEGLPEGMDISELLG